MITGPDWLDGPVTTSAYAWRLERKDGVALGFVSHDRDIVIDDFRYRAAPGMIPSSLVLSDSLDIDHVDLAGVMTSAALREEDLAAGRWNGAQLDLLLVDWTDPAAAPFLLLSGELGEINRSEDRFEVELLGPAAALDAALVPRTSPTCRARLGDRQCKLNLQLFRRELTLTAVENDGLIFAGLGGEAAGFALGELRWLSGRNSGLRLAIISGEGDLLRLADPPPAPVQAGDRALLTQGCDKNFATCRDRFGNQLNFRGEPHLPGNDLLTRYPGG